MAGSGDPQPSASSGTQSAAVAVDNGGNMSFLDAQRGWADTVTDWGRYYLMRTK